MSLIKTGHFLLLLVKYIYVPTCDIKVDGISVFIFNFFSHLSYYVIIIFLFTCDASSIFLSLCFSTPFPLKSLLCAPFLQQ